MKDPQVNDWVSFRSSGQLVIGRVIYRRERASWQRSDILETDAGQVPVEHVLEVRGPQ